MPDDRNGSVVAEQPIPVTVKKELLIDEDKSADPLAGTAAGFARGLARVFARLSRILPGTISGIAEETAVYPLDLIKVRMQVGEPPNASTYGVLKDIWMREGVAGLFRGVSVPLVSASLYTTALFGTYGTTMDWLSSPTNSGVPCPALIAGATSGFVQSFITCPFELITRRLQLEGAPSHGPSEGHSSALRVARDIVRQQGPRKLFTGMGATLLRDVPGYAVYFGLYESIKKTIASSSASFTLSSTLPTSTPNPSSPSSPSLTPTTTTATVKAATSASPEEDEHESLFGVIVAGGLAGSAYALSTYPVDVVKTFMQVDPHQYPTMRSTVSLLRRQHGLSVFTRGMAATAMRSFPANAVGFLAYEVTSKFLG